MENKEYVFKGMVINGFVMLFVTLALFIASVVGIVFSIIQLDGSKQKSVTFTNRKENAYGDLLITKTVTGLDGSTQSFDFTLTLDGHEGREVIDGLVFTDGVATFSLADGESKTNHNLPVDTLYTITEAANPNYNGGEPTTKSGTIAPNSTDESGAATPGSSETFENSFTYVAQKSDVTLAK